METDGPIIQWTRQGLAVIGTHVAAGAEAIWRAHVGQHVPPAQRDDLRLTVDDWAGAQRTWAQPPDETVLLALRVPHARPALLLSGLPEAFAVAGA